MIEVGMSGNNVTRLDSNVVEEWADQLVDRDSFVDCLETIVRAVI